MNSPMAFALLWRKLLLVTCILLLQRISFAQNLSNTGKEFWAGYGHHQFMEPGMSNSQQMILYISAEQAANVTVSIYGTTWTRSYSIPANTAIATDLIPKTGFYDARLYSAPPAFGGTGSEGLFTNKGIHIESDVPVVVNTQIYGSSSSGATMLMPVESWGYAYTSLNSQQEYQDNCFSWMFIVAKENNTTVQITPSVPTRNGRPAGVPYIVTMHKGEIYQLMGAGLGGSKGSELTGTTVRSVNNADGDCFPIAAFSGSSRTYITCPGGNPSGGDNIIQQLLPEHTWGKRYLTAPFSNATAADNLQTNIYRVLVKDPSTIVKRNGTVLAPLIANAWYEYQSNTADLIEADRPVMMAQYMSSAGGCANTSGLGDPEMTYLSPLDQGVKKTVFYRTARENMVNNLLTLIVPVAGMPSLQIDGNNDFDYVYPHPQLADYNVVVKKWDAANAYSALSCDHPFTGTTYGLGTVESYAYNVGLSLKNLNGTGRINNKDGSSGVACLATPVELSVLLPYEPSQLAWKISNLGADITPSADVVQSSPSYTATEVIDGVTYYLYTLPQDYSFNAPGDHYIPVEATHISIPICDHKETIMIPAEVKPGPEAVITLTHPTACTLDTVYFSGNTTSNGYTLEKWEWTFPDGSTFTDRETKKVFPPGNQQARLEVTSAEGCIATATTHFVVYDRPAAGFAASTPALCEQSAVTFTDNVSAYAGSAPITERYWDFDNGTQQTVTVNDPQTVTYNTYGSYEVKLVAKVSELCISDTARTTMIAYAAPEIVLTAPEDCLSANNAAAFTSDPLTPDGQTIHSYEWDFGDGSGTSTDKDPAYQYAQDGTYPVKYTVYTSGGCSGDTTFDVPINSKPALDYSVVPPVCESAVGPVSVANASVLNNLSGTGVYSGPGINDAGGLIPATAGTGVHTAKYVFTTTAGCKDSISTDFTVQASPVLALSAPSGCLPPGGDAQFHSDPTVPDGQAITGYTWDFGDGTATSAEKDPIHRYAQAGEYDIVYTATTVNGCTHDTTFSVTLGQPPQLSYGVIPPVCASQQGPVSVALATEQHNLAGTGIYSGAGITATGNFDPAVAGIGTHPVKYVFTTTEGCIDSAESSIAVYPLPLASFVASADTVCTGAEISFTDMSTAGITGWSWDFGDGGTAAMANPARRFTDAGTFDVSLRVTDPAGCVSEPYSIPVVIALQPVVDAGPPFTVKEGTLIQLQPQVNDSVQVSFSWSPPGDFINPDVLRASLIATKDAVYTLTATGTGNCMATDEVSVTVIKTIKPPNAFSPNGDNINDTWVIKDLVYYTDCIVEVFNRYGQPVFRSAGYGASWDGTINGSPLPIGTYYYVIQLQPGAKPIAGSVTILK